MISRKKVHIDECYDLACPKTKTLFFALMEKIKRNIRILLFKLPVFNVHFRQQLHQFSMKYFYRPRACD